LRAPRAGYEGGTAGIMSGHLVVTAYDEAYPATLSPKILRDLLRHELRFDGPVITDGIEMAAVADRYGIPGAAMRAIAAGADGICVGGEHHDEQIVEEIRQTIAGAVAEGTLPEQRLAEAAERMRRLAAWPATARPAAGERPAVDLPEGVPIGLHVARRAIRVTRRDPGALPLSAPPHVIEMSPQLSLASDRHTPWGVGEPLGGLLPGTTVARFTERDGEVPGSAELDAALADAAGRPLVIVARYADRHRWLSEAIDWLLAARPDAIVVEMGLPGRTDR